MRFWLIVGLVIFIFLPFGIDQLVMNKFVTTWSKGDWAGFLGSYLGGGIGALITLGGVWWQVKKTNEKDKKDKTIGVLKGILYSLDRNLKTKNLEDILKRSFYVLDWYYGDTVFYKFYNSYIYEIFPEIIKENYKVIFELDFGKEIVDLNENIKEFNQNHKFLSFELKKKKDVMIRIKSKIESLKKSDFKKIFDELEKIKDSSLFFSNNFPEIRAKETKESILKKGKNLQEQIESLINDLDLIDEDHIFREEMNTILQYLLSEGIILSEYNNIFKIFEDMETLKKQIEDEIKKIENQ